VGGCVADCCLFLKLKSSPIMVAVKRPHRCRRASPRARGKFYKAVCQAVLLYGCETWTVTKSMLRVLEGFHHKCAHRISGLMARQTAAGWYYPPLATAMAEAGLYPIQEYIRRRQSTIAQYIATRPIYARCQAGPRLSGSASRLLRYWEQNHDNAMADFQARHPDPTAGGGAGAGAVETDDDDAGEMVLDEDDENDAEMDDDE
jgi:hypothetical protein